MTDDLSRRAGQPTHEALWPADLFTQGIGWVITARFKSEGARVQAGIFLVDVFCLGAKSAHYDYEDCDDDYYRRRIRNHYLSRFPSPLVTKASLSTAEAPGKPRSKPAALCRICSNTVAQETLRT